MRSGVDGVGSGSGVVDAVVVGSGPNGLAAAVTLARAGRSVIVLEARATPGGGARTADLGMPGYRHDVCSAIHPLAVASPFFRDLDLARHGLEFVHPDLPVAHPLSDGRAAVLERSVTATADRTGGDGAAWRHLFEPLVGNSAALLDEVMQPVFHVPRHVPTLARFGLPGLRSMAGLARSSFSGEAPKALLAGLAAHSMQPLTAPATAAFGMLLAVTAQSTGWPLARGGSQAIIDALVAELTVHGGTVRCNHTVRTWADLPASRSVFFDTSLATLADVAAHRLPESWRQRVVRFPRGPGVFKIDYALSAPIPWAAPECRRAGTVHVGGTLDEIAAGEAVVTAGRHADRPFCLVAQQSLFDTSRAPAGRHTAWIYCHVPNGSTRDMTAAIEAQMERFAPGFRDVVVARHTTTPATLERYNANYAGGDIGAGAQDLRHILIRPALRWSPYTTPNPRIFICSAAAPPGGGVHGMCGYLAARRALHRGPLA